MEKPRFCAWCRSCATMQHVIRHIDENDSFYNCRRYIFEIRLNQFLIWRIRMTNDQWPMTKMGLCIWTCVQGLANQTHYAEIELTMPSKATLLRNFVHCVGQWTRNAVLSKSAAMSLKCVLIDFVYLAEKGVFRHTNNGIRYSASEVSRNSFS